MKISTEIASAAKVVGEERAVEAVAKAGFDAWDFTMLSMCRYDWPTNTLLENDHPLAGNDYLKFARRLKQIGLDNGIICNQSHAPFPTRCKELCGYLKRAVECTAEAGGKICVIHPEADSSPEQNAEMYGELLPFAKACGVKLAAENMYHWDPVNNHSYFAACATPESFCRHIDLLDDDFMVACLDIGHAEMLGSDTTAVELIHALGHRLQALHLHDNDKIHDSHQIPFSMQISFEPIVRALKEIGYDGYFTLEASNYLPSFPEEKIDRGMRDLYESARKLADLFAQA